MSMHNIYMLMIWLIPAVQVCFFFWLLFLAVKKRKMLVIKDKSYSMTPFKLIATGALLAFFPAPVGWFDVVFLGFFPDFPGLVFLMFMLQAFGAVLMLIGFGCGSKQWKAVGLGKSVVGNGVVGAALGLVANLQSAYVHRLFFEGNVLFGTCLFALAAGFLAVAFLELAKKFTRFRPLGLAMVAMAFALLIGYIQWHTDADQGGFPDLANCVYINLIPTMLISVIAFVVAILAVRIPGARFKALGNVGIGQSVEVTPTEAIAATTTQRVEEQAKTEMNTSAEGNPKTDNAATEVEPDSGVLDKLKGYDDAQLRRIVKSPRLYTAAVVERARQLLNRREAWEEIKDLPDAELFEMTIADKGLYNNDVVEAASMELYMRDSLMLRAQFDALPRATVASIADGTSPAPEGIRLAARKYLAGD